MISFKNNNKSKPFIWIRNLYKKALNSNQQNIEAISIASYNKHLNEVNSRYVNLKIVDDKNFIFFTNYNSPKSLEFRSHEQISAVIFWPAISTQIRMKARIKKTPIDYNNTYFKSRDKGKNILAISSNQSKVIESYDKVKEKYKKIELGNELLKCPEYWGGFTFTPYEIEFWKGERNRLNKRDFFRKNKKNWKHYILEP